MPVLLVSTRVFGTGLDTVRRSKDGRWLVLSELPTGDDVSFPRRLLAAVDTGDTLRRPERFPIALTVASGTSLLFSGSEILLWMEGTFLKGFRNFRGGIKLGSSEALDKIGLLQVFRNSLASLGSPSDSDSFKRYSSSKNLDLSDCTALLVCNL
jgi:hypothetical protein